MAFVELDPMALAVVRAMAGDFADRYIGEVLLPVLHSASKSESANLKDIRAAFASPYRCLHAFFSHYAFARRGKDRDDLSQMAVLALRRTTSEDSITELLKAPDGTLIWENFAAICAERGRKNSEQLNRGLLQGMVELAQEIYAIDGIGSVTGWVLRGILQTDQVEPQFLRIVDIRGVGPKTTSTFLRDVVFLFGVEDQLDNSNRLYVQPVDRWVRLFASRVIPDLDREHAVDWVIAGKLAKYARKAGVSGVRFNMGATYFGTREVREPARFDRVLSEQMGF